MQRLLVTGSRFWSIQDWRGSGEVLFASLPTNFGSLPNVVERQGAPSRKVSQYWKVASVAGKMPNLPYVVERQGAPFTMISQYWQVARVAGKRPNLPKDPGRSIARQRDARCSSLCILYTIRSVYPPHGQWPAPMGSWGVVTWYAKSSSNDL